MTRIHPRAHLWTKAARTLTALGGLLAATAAPASARAEILAYDEHDGEVGGAVGWADDWPFAREGGELVQTAAYVRRRFAAPLSAAHATRWIAVTGRMAAPPAGYAYHVPMGVSSWTTAHQHHGLHFDTSSPAGLLADGAGPTSGIAGTTLQTWLARYVFGPANANGRYSATVSIWAGSGAGRRIDPGAPPAVVRTLADTTLDSLYAGQSDAQDLFFVERESVATTAREALAAPERDLYVVAHQDDDLLFMNPDIADSIQAGNSVETVYLTAGLGGNCLDVMGEREAGMKAAYAAMAGLANSWSCAEAAVLGKDLVRCALDGSAGRVGLVFLRLPSSPDTALLSDLWNGGAPTVTRVDRTGDECDYRCASDDPADDACDDPSDELPSDELPVDYTREELIDVLARLMSDFRASRVGTLNSDHGHAGDHTDHYHTSLFAFAAQQAYAAGHALQIYRGYDMSNEQANVSDEEFDITWDAFRWYAQCDRFTCTDMSACGTGTTCEPDNSSYRAWARRRYVASAIAGVSGRLGALGGKCLAAAGASSGAPVVLADCSMASTQQWTVAEDRIGGPGGRCLGVAGGSASNGAPVVLESCAGTRGQAWTMLDGGQIRGLQGRCLAVAGGNAANGTPVQMVDCSGAEAQRFAIQLSAPTRWSYGNDFSDAQIGTSQAYTRTVRLGDVNGDGKADACVRRADGVYCARSNGAGGFLPAQRYTTEFSDANGWQPAHYGNTIQLADIDGDGKADLCGRGAWGILCQVANAAGDAFVASGGGWWTYSFSDAEGFDDAPSYYRSIHLADVDADGYADVCGRGADGLRCAINTTAGSFGSAALWLAEMSDANGWLPEPYGATIQLGDIDGDGAADACGRGPSGVVCAVASASGAGFARPHVWSYSRGGAPDYGDGSEFDAAPSHWGSLGLGDVDGDGDADLCGRGASGALCALSNRLGFGAARPASNGAFGDAQGWLAARYGATVQPGDVDGDGRADLCGRASDGLWCALAP
ncbi:ricin-type beta-trefoil lectin domain protein [Sorangium sp. So ce542]|uniref:ricin-type beta-trefoil lectin domain protein n=1 Tax=Sorangium sp. So ce542 TaxID=3133316 RepID=UPI003F620BEF